ncbi:MAG: glycosyltransferase, partial [Methanomassiliicoccales archaeon]|nr:glycosyltransferase [Methanomassiliicoccales archaeon]
LLSIIIPTLNEGHALPACLGSIGAQTFKDHETIVIDSGSSDGTREAALGAGAKMLDYPGRPLGARHQGLLASQGALILLLDADQVLYPDSLERAVAAMEGADMLVLEESSYQPQGFLQRSISRQKAALQCRKEGIPPHCYPRLYRRHVLESAFAKLPLETLGEVFAYDDRILYAKASEVSAKVSFLPKGVMHIEERSWRSMMRHAYRQGRSSSSVASLGLGEEAIAPESSFALLRRAAANGYLTYSVLKEVSFRLGRRLG